MKQTRWSHFWIDLDDALQQWIGVCRLSGSFRLALLLRWFPGAYVDSLVTAPVNSKLHFTVAFWLGLSRWGFLPFSVSVLLTEKSLTFVAWGICFLLEFCSSTPIPCLPIIMLSLVFWTSLFSCLWLSVTEAVNGYERPACLCLLLLLGGLFVTGHVNLGTLRQVQHCTFPVSLQSGRGDVSAGYSFLGIGYRISASGFCTTRLPPTHPPALPSLSLHGQRIPPLAAGSTDSSVCLMLSLLSMRVSRRGRHLSGKDHWPSTVWLGAGWWLTWLFLCGGLT